MIAVGVDFLEPQLDSSFVNFPATALGDELPSLSCDFGDLISSSDIDQLLMQNFGDLTLPTESCMQLDVPSNESSLPMHSTCDLSSFLFEHTPRPQDLNLSLMDVRVSPQPTYNSSRHVHKFQAVTPPHSGGLTPTNLSRSTSPAWSESSGSMSTSSVPGGVLKESPPARCSNPLPRHKRPSHKRAEIKRRDKIKTSLDDIKDYVPSLRDKGKLSESVILIKAAEYVHHLKDEHMERGRKVAELRREIECLSAEIHYFQENLPAAGLKDDSSPAIDDLYQMWTAEESKKSTKFFIFSSITSKLFETFKAVVGPATSLNDLITKSQEWQSTYLALPVLRKQILTGMLNLSRQSSIVISNDRLKMEFETQTDDFIGTGAS